MRLVAGLTATNPYTGQTDNLLVQMADQGGTSLYEAILPLTESGSLAGQTKKSLLSFYDLVQELLRLALEAALFGLADAVARVLAYACCDALKAGR